MGYVLCNQEEMATYIHELGKIERDGITLMAKLHEDKRLRFKKKPTHNKV